MDCGRPLENKRIVVTGGKGPLGRVIEELFPQYGATLVKADVVDAPDDPYYMKCDVRESCQAVALMEFAAGKMGGIDGLVCGAAFAKLVFAEDMSDEQWMETVETSLYGAFYCNRAAFPYLKESKGNIVNIASTAALIGLPRGTTHHSAAKAGILGMTRSLAVEWGKYGIRINGIAPGQFKSPGLIKILEDEESRKDILNHIPLARAGEIREIATAIKFLLSDDASYVSGHVLVVDGGATIK
jgi:2-deoxy-D-gluconate 3-dehydrogenase